jgi:adenylosuccinate lyase
VAENRPLRDVLLQDATVRKHLSAGDIDRLVDPKNYIGSAKELAKKTLANLDRKL